MVMVEVLILWMVDSEAALMTREAAGERLRRVVSEAEEVEDRWSGLTCLVTVEAEVRGLDLAVAVDRSSVP